MPKLKTVKSAFKRISKVTATGKFMRRKMSAQHRAHGKSNRTRKEAKRTLLVDKADVKRIKRLIPYAK